MKNLFRNKQNHGNNEPKTGSQPLMNSYAYVTKTVEAELNRFSRLKQTIRKWTKSLNKQLWTTSNASSPDHFNRLVTVSTQSNNISVITKILQCILFWKSTNEQRVLGLSPSALHFLNCRHHYQQQSQL